MRHEAAAIGLLVGCDHELSNSLPAVWRPHMLEYVRLLY